jgi:hypothetical protein
MEVDFPTDEEEQYSSWMERQVKSTAMEMEASQP